MSENQIHAGRLRGTHLLMALVLVLAAALPPAACASDVPILLYHRFGPRVADSMTVRTKTLAAQLAEIERAGYHVTPLRQLVDHVVLHGPPPPPRSVVITVDDGHRSVYTELYPIVRRHHIPVTLFIYPSAISNASYAMTWQELRELHDSGLFDIQSHTYWHPNFAREKRRLAPKVYADFVAMQLGKSKQILEDRLETKVDLLAWPFGIHDRDLEQRARAAGYVAAFTMTRRPVRDDDDPMALPRFLITAAVSPRAFTAILETSVAGR